MLEKSKQIKSNQIKNQIKSNPLIYFIFFIDKNIN